MKSDAWKELRSLAVEETPYCVLCSAADGLQVHHRKYPTRFGDEPLSWLTVLCGKCHAKHHGVKYRKPKKKKKKKLKKQSEGGPVKFFSEKEIRKHERIHRGEKID
jgi:hypothetical protein